MLFGRLVPTGGNASCWRNMCTGTCHGAGAEGWAAATLLRAEIEGNYHSAPSKPSSGSFQASVVSIVPK